MKSASFSFLFDYWSLTDWLNIIIGDDMSLMLAYIGDPDSELRDDLICNTLYEWIGTKEYFNNEQLKQILFILMDKEHLFYQIGSDVNDSVFTRTFSVLGVAQILKRHRKQAFLSTEEFVDIKNKLIEYYISEMDLRGYIEGPGWAHAAAHGADAMGELAQCSESGEKIIREILNAFKKVMYNRKYIFDNEEDERISRVIFRIIKDNLLSKQVIIKWLEELSDCIEWHKDRQQYVTRINIKNVIRSLYFKIMYYDCTLDIIDTLSNLEKKLNRFFELDKELTENRNFANT